MAIMLSLHNEVSFGLGSSSLDLRSDRYFHQFSSQEAHSWYSSVQSKTSRWTMAQRWMHSVGDVRWDTTFRRLPNDPQCSPGTSFSSMGFFQTGLAFSQSGTRYVPPSVHWRSTLGILLWNQKSPDGRGCKEGSIPIERCNGKEYFRGLLSEFQDSTRGN